MKTHNLAKVLTRLAKALRAGPNVDVEGLSELLKGTRVPRGQDELAVNLATLASLSNVDKHQWASLILYYGLPIHIRPRDASRDVLGKLLTFLQDNPEALMMLKDKATKKWPQASPELMRALNSLLRGSE